MRWKTEASFLTHIPASYARNGLYRTASAATLVGIEAPGSLRNIDVKGYALGSAITNRAATPAISNQGDGEFGADVKWGRDAELSSPTSPTTPISRRSKTTSSRST